MQLRITHSQSRLEMLKANIKNTYNNFIILPFMFLSLCFFLSGSMWTVLPLSACMLELRAHLLVPLMISIAIGDARNDELLDHLCAIFPQLCKFLGCVEFLGLQE